MKQPFDLERFKAGESAWGKDDGTEFRYCLTAPDGTFITMYTDPQDGRWFSSEFDLNEINDYLYMKPKEEWVLVCKHWKIYPTKEAAEATVKKYHNFLDYVAVKIVRE